MSHLFITDFPSTTYNGSRYVLNPILRDTHPIENSFSLFPPMTLTRTLGTLTRRRCAILCDKLIDIAPILTTLNFQDVRHVIRSSIIYSFNVHLVPTAFNCQLVCTAISSAYYSILTSFCAMFTSQDSFAPPS